MRNDYRLAGTMITCSQFSRVEMRLPYIAHRPKDLEDIRTITDKYPKLDVKRIEKWVKSFGEVLETPDLWDLINSLLK